MITWAWVVTLAFWLTPMPRHSAGWIVNYGSPRVSEANATFRGYSLEGFVCGAAVMSPSDLGKIVWVREVREVGGEDAAWHGPCLAVDVSSRKDFYPYVMQGEILEIDRNLADHFGMRSSMRGEVWKDPCPPDGRETQPRRYRLREPVQFDLNGDRYSYWKVGRRPQESIPDDCPVNGLK